MRNIATFSTGEQIASLDARTLRTDLDSVPDDAVVFVISKLSRPNKSGKHKSSTPTDYSSMVKLICKMSGDDKFSDIFATAFESALLTAAVKTRNISFQNYISLIECNSDNSLSKNATSFWEVLTTPRVGPDEKQSMQLVAHKSFASPIQGASATENDAGALSALRDEIFNSTRWLKAKEVSAAAHSTNSNPSALANKWKRENKIFAVQRSGVDYYPLYAFGDDGKPLAVLSKVLALFNGNKTPWSIAGWFASKNGWLGGATPMSMIGTNPNDVLEAAKMETNPSEHG